MIISVADMIHLNYKVITITFNFIITFSVLTDASTNLYRPKSRSDDEDSVTGSIRNIQSSGDGPNNSPDVYPILDPYTKTRSTATILVDVAFEHSYKSYMLPGQDMTTLLWRFHYDIIENFKIELHNLAVELEFKILSLRPGPLISKKNAMHTEEILVSTVFVRMNITQHNSSIVNPLIIFRISQCGRLGVLGNATIAEQIIFPQYVCTHNQVYCLPKCRNGTYCDGVFDCPDTQLDEPKSCPQCLYKNVNLFANTHILDEGEVLNLDCNFSRRCQSQANKIRWKFPIPLMRYEDSFSGSSKVNSLPTGLISSGLYRCTMDDESSSINITVFKKPVVSVTKADPDAETVIISEIEGTQVDYWCNTTDGSAIWTSATSNGIEIRNYNERSSKITFKEITKVMANNYHCQVQWGFDKSKIIKKTTTVIVLCDLKKHFECKNVSLKRSCIPINQKCDLQNQCDDGSDEVDCDFCQEKELSIDVGRRVVKDIGDTLIMTCSSSKNICKPTSWWSRGEQIGPTGNIFSFMESLFIVQAKADNTGRYQCFDVSKRSSVSVYVHINDAPTVRLSPQISIFNITQSHSATIECSVSYPTNVTYKKTRPRWIKINQNSLPTDVDIISGDDTKTMIVFNKAQFTMSGIYECESTWGTLNNKVVRVAVTVNVTPLICNGGEKMCVDNTMCLSESLWCDGFTHCRDGTDEKSCDRCTNGYVFVEPRHVTVLVGQTVELLCYYDKDCYPVKWKLANSQMSLSSINGLVVHDNKLVFNNVGLDATNTYECYSGIQRFQSNVTVIKKVELNLSAPYAIVSYNQNINVSCQSNYGKPQWRRRDSKPLSSIDAIHVTQPSENIANLIFTSPSYDSNGYYVCFVRLSAKEDELARMLMYVYVKGLSCSSDQIICDSNTKCISKSQICDSVYDCKDGEDEKTCSKCTSNLEIKPNQLTVTTLGYGVINCIIPSPDCLPITWKFKNRQSLKNSRFHPFENSLYIINPRISDSDEIMCTSGDKSASALLDVKELTLTFEPDQRSDYPLFMMRGQSTKIYCKSNIGTARWIFPEESLVTAFGVRYNNIGDNVAILDITNIQKEATNKYLCEVEFSRETKRKNVSITVI